MSANFDEFDRNFRDLHNRLKGRAGFTQEEFQQYLNRVGELLLTLIQLVGPAEYHLRYEMSEVASRVTVRDTLSETDYAKTNTTLLGAPSNRQSSRSGLSQTMPSFEVA